MSRTTYLNTRNRFRKARPILLVEGCKNSLKPGESQTHGTSAWLAGSAQANGFLHWDKGQEHAARIKFPQVGFQSTLPFVMEPLK